PWRTKTAAIVLSAIADDPMEAQWKLVDSLSFNVEALTPIKASAIVVLTDEIVRALPGLSDMLLERELVGAVGSVTSQRFLADITAGVSPQSSAGSDAVAVHADCETLLGAVDVGSTSRLHWVM